MVVGVKFIRLHVDAGLSAIGIEHEFGRIERVLVVVEDAPQAHAIAGRATEALNACAELSDGTLALMAKGGTRYGSLAERVAMVALLWGENGRLAERLLARARDEIKKAGGKI